LKTALGYHLPAAALACALAFTSTIAWADEAPLSQGRTKLGTAGHDHPALDAAIIDYVSTFEKKAAGEHFNPHVSTGNAPTTYLDEMVGEPFESFPFSPAHTAVYQLGPFGTAAKKLQQLD